MKMNLKFEGGADLSRALSELGKDATVAGRRSLRATANEFRDALRAAAPRNAKGETKKSWTRKDGSVGSARYGQLRENIKVRESRARVNNTIVMMVTTGNAFWGSFLEWGTVKMRARPWFRPVWDRMQNVLIARLGQKLGGQIEKAAKRVAKRGVLPNGRNS